MKQIKTYIANRFVDILEEDFSLTEANPLQEYFNAFGLFTPTDYSIGRIFLGLEKTIFLYADRSEEAETEKQREEGIENCSNVLIEHLQHDKHFILLNYTSYVPFCGGWPDDKSDAFEYDKRIAVLASEPYSVTIDEDNLHYVRASTVVNNSNQIKKVSRLALEHYCPSYTLMGLTTKMICAIYHGGIVIFDPAKLAEK